jgi:electron transfer flavoprotein alpha subunit
MAQIFAYITHKDGVADDSAMELFASAKKIDANASLTAVVTGAGADLDTVCNKISEIYSEVWKVDNQALAYPNAEIIRKVLVNILPAKSIVLFAHNTFGMDIGPGFSIKFNSSFIPDVVDIQSHDGKTIKVARQEYGGAVSTHVEADISSGVVITIRPGSFQADESKTNQGQIVDKSGDAGDLSTGRRFLEVVEAEVGDVDITKEDILVSIGRGIEDEENIEIAQELAKAMGGVVSCSRPIIDAKWMEKSRQVGTSGLTVKPKVYLACGISGSFQHMGGVKGNPFIVAINKNPNAPIFQMADIGIEADILDFLPELTENINEIK